eukprot:362387-Chlamydomonas_euryale.AAC.2
MLCVPAQAPVLQRVCRGPMRSRAADRDGAPGATADVHAPGDVDSGRAARHGRSTAAAAALLPSAP